MDAQERTQLRSEVFPLSADDTLRHRGTVLSYDRRTYRDGLRREPILVYTSGDGMEAHYDKAGNDVLIVSDDGDEYFVTVDAKADERDQIPFSE